MRDLKVYEQVEKDKVPEEANVIKSIVKKIKSDLFSHSYGIILLIPR